MLVECMNLKKMESYLRVNLLGPGPRLMKKELPGRGLTKVEKHWFNLSRKDLNTFNSCKEYVRSHVQVKWSFCTP